MCNNSKDEIVCYCFGVRYAHVETAVRQNNFKGIEQIVRYTRAGGGCRGCQQRLREIIDQTRQVYGLDEAEEAKWGPHADDPPDVPVIKKIRLVNQVLDELINPHFERMGVSFELDNIKGREIHLLLQGERPAEETEQAWIERIKKEINAVVGTEQTVRFVEAST